MYLRFDQTKGTINGVTGRVPFAHTGLQRPLTVGGKAVVCLLYTSGPIIYEYYAGTEDIGTTQITPEEWLSHPGSVGRSMTECHIVGENGEELPPGRAGAVYFGGGRPFEYHNDPQKTASVTNEHGWRTLGDVGYLDEDGYLYLTDRQAHMIISGGVNTVSYTHLDVYKRQVLTG